MAMQLAYAIHFVADMERAVAFYRDPLGLELRCSAPGWSEFATGATTLALHPAPPTILPAARASGCTPTTLRPRTEQLSAAGVRFTRLPTPEHGVTLAEFVDCEAARVSLSG